MLAYFCFSSASFASSFVLEGVALVAVAAETEVLLNCVAVTVSLTFSSATFGI